MCQGPEVRASTVGQETETLWSENMMYVGVVGAVRWYREVVMVRSFGSLRATQCVCVCMLWRGTKRFKVEQ